LSTGPDGGDTVTLAASTGVASMVISNWLRITAAARRLNIFMPFMVKYSLFTCILQQ